MSSFYITNLSLVILKHLGSFMHVSVTFLLQSFSELTEIHQMLLCFVFRWVIYNDHRVCASERPPKDLGYMYFYRRIPS